MSATAVAGSQDALDDLIVSSYHDPLAFVLGAYPWGEVGGPLEHEAGPDVWQRDFLTRLGEAVTERAFDGHAPVAPIRMAVSGAHGVGKGVLVAWLVDWIMATRPQCRGTLTANTFTQLETKTWAALHEWHAMCLTGDRFTMTTTRMYHTAYKETWFCAPQSSKEENSEAFAGQHEKRSTSFYIFDEASAIPDEIWRVAEGGLTDGEAMFFAFGNPTRSQGSFHAACFGVMRKRWDSVVVDSRECRFTNKTQIQEWKDDYGENSDFFRVRVRGLPPAASDLQYISNAIVYEAQKRACYVLDDEPLVCGLDVARGGKDSNVFRFRRGRDARSIPAIRIPGVETKDTTKIIDKAKGLLSEGVLVQGGGAPLKIAHLFIDGTGIGGPIFDRLKQLGFENITEVQFGGAAPLPSQTYVSDRAGRLPASARRPVAVLQKYANMRAYMWGQMREWLSQGAIDDSSMLEQDLTGPGYTHDKQDRIVLESKEHMKARKVDSPDDGDALALTFAASVVKKHKKRHRPVGPPPRQPFEERAYDPLGWMA